MAFRSKKKAELLTFQKCNEMFKKARYCKYLSTNVTWTGNLREVEKIKGVRLENNTYLLQHTDCYCVRYHQTDIIDIYPDKWVIRNGGWRTPSTKDRINRLSPINVSTTKGCWYYVIGNWNRDAELKVFKNGLVITKLDVFEYMV